MMPCDDKNMDKFLKFILGAPDDQEIIEMDCNDYCENLACLAEQVAAGQQVEDLLPKLEKFMHYWSDCREEFEALVAILRAEQSGALNEVPDPSE